MHNTRQSEREAIAEEVASGQTNVKRSRQKLPTKISVLQNRGSHTAPAPRPLTRTSSELCGTRSPLPISPSFSVRPSVPRLPAFWLLSVFALVCLSLSLNLLPLRSSTQCNGMHANYQDCSQLPAVYLCSTSCTQLSDCEPLVSSR